MELKYFKLSEFDSPDTPGSGAKMDSAFLLLLDELRQRCGFPFVISSGYRTPAHNAAVSETGLDGPHTTGKAADVLVNGENAYLLVQHAFAMGFHGIGVSQKDDFTKRFIHLDMVDQPRPRIWSY